MIRIVELHLLCLFVLNRNISFHFQIAQDANLFVTELEKSKRLPVPIVPGRMGYMLVVEGTCCLTHATTDAGAAVDAPSVEEVEGGIEFVRHDGAEIQGTEGVPLQLVAGEGGCHVMLFEMAKTGSGRTDLVE